VSHTQVVRQRLGTIYSRRSVIHDQTSEALNAVLAGLTVRGSCYCRAELTAPWGLAADCGDGDGVGFHFVASGACWLVDAEDASRLHQGDLVVFPRADAHRLGDTLDPAERDTLELPRQSYGVTHLVHGGGGERAVLLSGGTRFDPSGQPLVELLPRVLHLRANAGQTAEWVRSTVRVMAIEAEHPRPGSELILARLCDILIIHAVRAWLEDSPAARDGWLGALREKHLGRALLAIHERPDERWTIASLAAEATMSRSVFADRFTTATGMSPMAYVTRQRMALATSLMREHGYTPEQAALAVGYGSLAAFSRAYKRTMGSTPSQARRAALTEQATWTSGP
jgi:AraC-like DNA-binding protein